MYVRRKLRAVICLLAASAQACATLSPVDHATRSSYAASQEAYSHGDPVKALTEFPREEPNGFITTVERGWLGMMARKPQADELIELTRNMEDRKTLRVSREAKSFFYKDAPDGYFPAEHEAIIVHVISAMNLLQEGKRAEAAVDVRRAAFYLEREFAGGQGFDDAGLRAWLGALWLAVGEWDHARVDFRIAAQLSQRFAQLKQVADADAPPTTFAIMLAGPGPSIDWNPGLERDMIAGATRLVFVPGEDPRRFALRDAGGKTRVEFSKEYPTISWYDRHQNRDHAIKDVLDRSEYMLRAAGGGGVAGVTILAGAGAAFALGTAGLAGGLMFFWGALRSIVFWGVDAELALYVGLIGGVSIGTLGFSAASAVYKASERASEAVLRGALSKVEDYRYVRFLPDHIYVATSEERFRNPRATPSLGLDTEPLLALPGVGNGQQVLFFASPAPLHPIGDQQSFDAWKVAAGTHQEVFQPINGKSDYEDAQANCAKLGEVPGSFWSLPDYRQLSDAIKKGFKPPSGATHAWLKLEGTLGMTPCHALTLTDSPRDEIKPCFEQHAAICVKKVSGRK